MCFLTDPYLSDPFGHIPNWKLTEDLIELLVSKGINVATLSKRNVSFVGLYLLNAENAPKTFGQIKSGMTIVSLDEAFWRQYESNAPAPMERLRLLKNANWPWISMEPSPCSDIYKQDLQVLLEQITEVVVPKLIVFGMWNYDGRSRTEKARLEYARNVEVLTDFCRSNKIRRHVKSDTLKFISEALS